MTERTLTVFAHTGLSNRLYVLTSGLALAGAAGRAFRMLWPRTSACGAAFNELFSNDWPVDVVDERALADQPYGWSLHNPRPPDVLTMPADSLVLGGHHTLLRPDLYPAHKALVEPCLAYFRQLQPIPHIADAVATFRAQQFRPRMIGVHLRRGDYAVVRPDLMGNTAPAIAAVDAVLRNWPEAGIFLATDDDLAGGEGVRAIFTRRFGKRVVCTTPCSLDRNSVAAIQDGLLDLWLLRQTDYVIGSAGSAFSRLAAHGRSVPLVLCRGATAEYRRAYRLYQLSGFASLVRWLGRYEFHRDLPLPTLLRYYRAAAQHQLDRVLRRRPIIDRWFE